MAARDSQAARRARAEAERARLYAARTEWHNGVVRRRTRDNTIVGVVGGVLIAAAIASQAVHADVVASAPSPSGTTTPTTISDPFATLFPTPETTDAP